MQSRSKQAIKNVMANIMYQLVAAVCGLIIPKLILETFGSAINGLSSSITQFITYLTLVEMGISQASTIALYKPIAENNRNDINATMSSVKRYYINTGLYFLALLIVMVFVYPSFVKDDISVITIRLLVIILALTYCMDYFLIGKYKVLLMADQRAYVSTAFQIFGTILSTILCICFLYKGESIVIVKFSLIIGYIVRYILIKIYVKKRYSYLNFKVPARKGAIKQRKDILIHQISSLVVNNTDVGILTIVSSTLSEVSVYNIFNMVGLILSNLLSSLSSSLSAGIGQIIALKDYVALKNVYSNFEYIYQVITFWLYSCMGILIMPFIAWYTKSIVDVNYYRELVGLLFAIKGITTSVRIPIATIVNSRGDFKQTRNQAILESVINISVSLVLVFSLGIIGVLIGTIVSNVYRTIHVYYYCYKKIIAFDIRKTINRLIRNTTCALVTYLLLYKVITGITMSNFIIFFGYAAFVTLVTFFLFFVVNLLTEFVEMKNFISRVFHAIRH